MTFDDLYQKELNRNQAQAQSQSTEQLESTPSEFIHNFQSLTSGLDDLIVKSKHLLDDGISALNGNFILADEEEVEDSEAGEETEETEETEEDDESKSQKLENATSKVHAISEITTQATRTSSSSDSSSTRPISTKNKTSSSPILRLLKHRMSHSSKRNSSHSDQRHESQSKPQKPIWSQFKKIIRLYCALNPIPIPTQSKTKRKTSHSFLNALRSHYFKI